MSNILNNQGSILDPKILSEAIKNMDKDVAARFVASAFSLNKKKMIDAFTCACKEMQIRQEAAEKKQLEIMKESLQNFPAKSWGVKAKPELVKRDSVQKRQLGKNPNQSPEKNIKDNFKENLEKLLKDLKKRKK